MDAMVGTIAPFWTEDRVERLKELVAQGMTAAQISRQLAAISRSAIIGKCHRLGIQLKAHGSGLATKCPPRKTPKKRVRTAPLSGQQAQPVGPTHPQEPAGEPDFLVADDTEGPTANVEHRPDPHESISPTFLFGDSRVHFFSASSTQCAFPLWGPEVKTGFVCGQARQAGSSYCPEHHARCWEKVGSRARRPWTPPRKQVV